MPAYLGVHGRLNRQRSVPHSQRPLQSRAISPLARRLSFRSSSTMSSFDVQSVWTDMTLHVIIMGTSSSAGILGSRPISVCRLRALPPMNSLSYYNNNGLIGFPLDSALTNVVESHSSSDQAICVNVLFLYPDIY